MFQEADIVPEFKIQTDKQEFSLNKSNQNFTVVFFFPRANTSGCTKEANEFSEIINDFERMNTRVIGISKDTIEQQKKFREKHDLKCELGSDVDGSICDLFSVWVEKSMYGKKYMGIQRSTFLIDKDRKILKTWPKVKVPNHAKEVLGVISDF
ncbi:MAG: peroxiredoxin [SAR116 cluster bacterium]|nr:peroxiredoxin [SAR116 cluster bacterium]